MEENAIPLNFLSQRRTRNKTYSSIRDSLQEENESRDHLRARQNTRTVVVMVSLYALAFAISALHVGFYYWLNDRIVDESIPQEPQTFVSNMFSIAFELASLGCIGVAYTQRLWQLFRQVPINALTIDHLFTLPRNPMHLFHGRIFRKAPVEYLVGIVCALLPIAITFPPSAVNIAPRQIPPIPRRLGPVNSFEILDYNQSIADIKELAQNVRERALMYLDSDFNTFRLKPELERIAYRTLLVSDSLPWPNPCIDLKSRYSSPNCSYPLTIKGPELDCTDISAEETHVLSGSKDPYNTTLFEAGFPSLTDDSFHIGWYPESQVSCEDKDKRFCEVISKDEPKFLSCSAALAEYSVQVTFNDTMRILDFPPPKAGEMIPGHVSLYRNFNPSESAPPERDLPSSYQLVQALAIRDALFRSLEGRLSFGSSVFSEERTHILQSRFSNGGTISELNNITTLRLDITKNRLQDFMHDITFSLVHLARPHWENDTDVIEMKYVNKYEFNSKPNIYVPYGLSLAATFAILILGLISLRSNGAPADDGFLQIVCSTRASKVLDEAAKRVCRGEDAHAAVELTGLELVFGDIEQKDNGHRGQGDEALEEVEEHASVLTGFGTLDEVRSMKRRI